MVTTWFYPHTELSLRPVNIAPTISIRGIMAVSDHNFKQYCRYLKMQVESLVDCLSLPFGSFEV